MLKLLDRLPVGIKIILMLAIQAALFVGVIMVAAHCQASLDDLKIWLDSKDGSTVKVIAQAALGILLGLPLFFVKKASADRYLHRQNHQY